MMRKMFAATVLAATLAGAGAASALPMAPVGANGSADVIQVAQGCGPGWARGPYGRCRPMYGRGPVVVAPRVVAPVVVAPRVVAPRVVAPRACPPGYGWHRGRCIRF